MPEKTALILSGGGMRTSYTAGVLSRFAEDPNIPDFDMVIGGSGASAIGAFYVTRQFEFLKSAWGLLATKKFISLTRFWNVVDRDYLTHQVLTEKLPLDISALKNGKTELLIPAMNAKTEKIAYFSSRDPIDILTVIKATHSIPFLSKSVTIDGEKYRDSFETSFPWFHVESALARGATKIVVVSCLADTPVPYVFGLEKLLLESRSLAFGKKHSAYHQQMIRDSHVLKQKENIRYISPSVRLTCHDFTIDPDVLKKSFETGYGDALHAHVSEFLNT